MKKRVISRLIGLVVLFVFLFGSISPAASQAFSAKINYVALGDSLAAGMVPDRKIDKGYTGVIAEQLELLGLLESYSNDFAVPGYTTQNVLDDLVNNKEVEGNKIQDAIEASNLVTLTAGANDILKELSIDRATGKVTFDPQKAKAVVAAIQSNITSILDEIEEVNPETEVYVSGYYNAFPYLPAEQQALLQQVLTGLNGVIQKVAIENGAIFVSLDSVFGDSPTTYLPDPSDIHPNQAGYELIADAFVKAFLDNEKLNFVDVPEDFWAYTEIKLLVDNKVMSGVSENAFAPNKPITRAEAAQTLYGVLPFDKSVPPNPEFKDVSQNNEAYYAIAKLTQAGVFAKAEKFNPNSPLTRAEMSKILVLAFQLEGSGSFNFKDVSSEYWAAPFIDALAANKVSIGYPDNSFRPVAPTTKAEFAVFVVRALSSKLQIN
ncbi:S-layer homology domain-containing protein [Cytobacillus sp. S13-E01]|uniref:S-layer homology domain-containing protein n=1 Tax=Cytobacillus sp. S13-E01 TaxID=3031326 RepID=UPI0023D8BC07|nr:S-layer homology domain-containing protein [Cytobacillus sp. S13-E01]MDF0726052.1 S-layer homology domain-containing protein [Cytobacillus sp. S13-E01]